MTDLETIEGLKAELELQKHLRKVAEDNLEYAQRHQKLIYTTFGEALNELDKSDFNTAKQRKQLQSFLTSKFVKASDAIIELCKFQMGNND